MSVLGVITCEILELELAHLLAGDHDVVRITVIEDQPARRLANTLESLVPERARRIPHVRSFRPEHAGGLEVLVRVLEVALHRRKVILRKALFDAARELCRLVHALVLGYGRCGDALDDPAVRLDVEVPVFVPRDGSHPVDDCVALLLGGRRRYRAELCAVPGTYFMTPGWAEHWTRTFGRGDSALSHATARRVFQRYERALLLATPFMSHEELARRVEPFVDLTGVRLEARESTLSLLDTAWNAGKEYVGAACGSPATAGKET